MAQAGVEVLQQSGDFPTDRRVRELIEFICENLSGWEGAKGRRLHDSQKESGEEIRQNSRYPTIRFSGQQFKLRKITELSDWNPVPIAYGHANIIAIRICAVFVFPNSPTNL
jgi:hypothetical protein